MKVMGLILVLALTVTGFYGHIHRQLATPLDVSPMPGETGGTATMAAADIGAHPDAVPLSNDNLTDTLQRPLFFRDRRKFSPPPPPEKPKVVAATPRPKPVVRTPARTETTYQVLGISIGDGRSKALIASKGVPATWVKQGDRLESWLVQTIDANTVHLTGRSGTIELELYPKKEH